METITNITNAASKAIWGANAADEEPVAGVKGNTSQGEPYDAGNIEDPLEKQKKAKVADANTFSTSGSTTGSTKTSEPTTTAGLTTTVTPSRDNQSTGPAAAPQANPKNNESTSTPTILTDRSRAVGDLTSRSSSATKSLPDQQSDIGKPELKQTPLKGVSPAVSATGKTDTRDPSDPATDPTPRGQDVDNAAGPTTAGDKLDGPGPRPLETVAKERGGDAGNLKKGSNKSGLLQDDEAAGSLGDDNEIVPNEPSHGEGTGEKYIKTSGLAADGGDFDATKPGAGREADRLLDEKDPAHAATKAAATSSSENPADKGIEKVSGGRTSSPNTGSEKEKEKESFKDKIKAKLHRH